MRYVFSWYSSDPVAKILHPKWWQIWQRATLYTELQSVRHTIFLPEAEGKLIKQWFNGSNPTAGSIVKLILGNKPTMLQLEESENSGFHRNYIASEYVSTGLEKEREE